MYLQPHNVATRLSITEAAVCRMVDAGDIPFVRLPTGQVRFIPGEIDGWLRRLQHLPPATTTTNISTEDSLCQT